MVDLRRPQERERSPSRRWEGFSASLIETGRVNAGITLRDSKSRHAALVRPDGQLMANGIVGSIHKVGALVQGLPACNGWTFWHIDRGKGLEPIDAIRAEIRAGA